MIDLHTHSYFSDGTLSPSELIAIAESHSMKAIALTDHDTTSGLIEGTTAAEKKKVIFIPGIELSVTHTPGELHIVGLGLKNWKDAPLLLEINRNRKSRNIKMISIMNDQGLKISYDDLKKLTKGTIGRPHFASWMVSEGYVGSMKEAFTKYLTKGTPFYLPRETVSLESAIEYIHNCKGYAIVAHPLQIPVNFSTLLEKIDKLMELGIDGIEAVHSGAKHNLTKRLIKYGESKGLMLTGGSDFHGENKPKIKLGRTRGFGTISDDFLPEALLSYSLK